MNLLIEIEYVAIVVLKNPEKKYSKCTVRAGKLTVYVEKSTRDFNECDNRWNTNMFSEVVEGYRVKPENFVGDEESEVG